MIQVFRHTALISSNTLFSGAVREDGGLRGHGRVSQEGVGRKTGRNGSGG